MCDIKETIFYNTEFMKYLIQERDRLKINYRKDMKRINDQLKYFNVKKSTIKIDNRFSDTRKLFKNMYKEKMKKIFGDERGFPWTGKEAKLLKLDIEAIGVDLLKKYFTIFFKDLNNDIADFTRYKINAGYTYPVFHGMLGKLAMTKFNSIEPCKYCGCIGYHDYTCKISVMKREEQEKELKEINDSRKDLKDFSIMKEIYKQRRQ